MPAVCPALMQSTSAMCNTNQHHQLHYVHPFTPLFITTSAAAVRLYYLPDLERLRDGAAWLLGDARRVVGVGVQGGEVVHLSRERQDNGSQSISTIRYICTYLMSSQGSTLSITSLFQR